MAARNVTRDVKSYWSERAEFWDTMYDTDSRFWRWFNRVFRRGIFRRAELAVRTCRDAQAKCVLDVGCGSGRVSCLLAEQGIQRVVGVDTVPAMLKRARELATSCGVSGACEFIDGDFRTTPLAGPFDGVLALGVFDYLDDPLPFLVKMRELASGFVVASFPSPTLVRAPLRKIRYGLRGCPVFFYRRKRIEKLFRDAGFPRFDLIRPTRGGYDVVGWVGPRRA